MPKKQIRHHTRVYLAKNLSYLMSTHELSLRDVAARTNGEVSWKTVGNMLNTGGCSIDKVEAVAAVFGLEGWHLVMHNLISDLQGETSIRELYESYLKASPEGRRHIIRIAQREAEFQESTPPKEVI